MTPEQARALRAPFPAEAVGKLPKAGVYLDYVGHAAVTDRLLAVDPDWTWEPFALTDAGLPALDGRNLWIRLTVCGRTLPAVGDGSSLKECIGDAIRNGAMRFGVALDLWAKEDLTAIHADPPPIVVTDAQTLAELEAEIDAALGLESLQTAGSHVAEAVNLGLLSDVDRLALQARYKKTAADLKPETADA